MRHAPALAAALCALLLLGCPDATTPGSAPGGGPPSSPDVSAPSQEDPVADPSDGTSPNPAPASEWRLIDDAMKAELGWPIFEPVTRWPAPSALVDLGGEREQRAGRAADLRQLVETLVSPSLHPNDFAAALKLDSAGHLHLTVGRGRPQGSATLDSHGPDYPPVFTLVLEKPGPRATKVAALREAVAQVVAPDLARELAQKENMLEAHPKVAGAATAFLDRSGFGAQFPYLYAFSSDDHLLLVFQEVPHGKAPEPR